MTEQQPTVGRIVHYRLSERDVADIFAAHGTTTGRFEVGDVLPAIVIRTYEPDSLAVDFSVQLGNATLLRRTSGYSVQTTGCWFWPPRMVDVSGIDKKPGTEFMRAGME